MEPGISSAIVVPVLRALGELGFTVPAQPEGEVVPGSAADALIERAAKTLGRDDLGLELAKRVPIGALGMLDYALCTSPTLREGLGRTSRFYGMATQRVRLSVLEQGDTATLRFDPEPGNRPSRHWLEFSFALICERIRSTLGVPVAFSEITFNHPAPADQRPHDVFFAAPVRFAAQVDGFSFEARLLGLPLLTASASLAEVLELKMRALEPTLQGDALLANARRAVLALLDKRDVRLASAAAKLEVGSRTLQRELQRRGTSHQALVDDARRGRARELLETGLTVAEVAERLGFSEPSAFFRAFRRWTGQTPKEAVRP